jgi:phosphoglycolate phosphatase
VATADRKENCIRTLKKAGLDQFFDFIAGEDSVPRGKPEPDLMNLFCKEFSIAPREVAMVGDTLRDMEFARNARAGQAIFVGPPGADGESMADLVLEDINQIISDPRSRNALAGKAAGHSIH